MREPVRPKYTPWRPAITNCTILFSQFNNNNNNNRISIAPYGRNFRGAVGNESYGPTQQFAFERQHASGKLRAHHKPLRQATHTSSTEG